jgi:hypothetical protein
MSRALAKFGLFPSESEVARRFSQDPSAWASKVIVWKGMDFRGLIH